MLGEADGLVAVAKPAGTPVHVAGQYRKNTVCGIIEADFPHLVAPPARPLAPVHRLDKPVSGVLLLARGAAAADAVRLKIESREIEKLYLARVQGASLACSRSTCHGPVFPLVGSITPLAGCNLLLY